MVMAVIQKAQRIHEAYTAGEYDQDTMFRAVSPIMNTVDFPKSFSECLNQAMSKPLVPENNSYISRHRTFFEFRKIMQVVIFNIRMDQIPTAVGLLVIKGYNCSAVIPTVQYLLSRKNALVMAYSVMDLCGMTYSGCDFFPELKEPTEDFATESHRRFLSLGFEPQFEPSEPPKTDLLEEPQVKDFWQAGRKPDGPPSEKDLLPEKEHQLGVLGNYGIDHGYCEWLIARLTDSIVTQQ
uniref:Ubiquitinyl hydrolase 1 n=1 Tax=Steinernema glaseri TaxID=37863 RepID=A0A1I7ZA04_9BILA